MPSSKAKSFLAVVTSITSSLTTAYSVLFVFHMMRCTRPPSAVTTMRYVHRTVPSIPVATVHAWSDSEDGNGIGTPHMLLDWIDGKALEWNVNAPPPATRQKVLGQLAQYTVDLQACIAMYSGPQSALTWILRRIDSRLTRISTGELPAFDPAGCWSIVPWPEKSISSHPWMPSPFH